MFADPHRPKLLSPAHPLEVQRGVIWIGLQEFVVLICQLLNGRG